VKEYKHIFIYLLVILAAIIIAARFPIGNDEAYYIAFAKNRQLSYVDAPPFVAYLNIIQSNLHLFQPLVNRLWVIILHLISTGFLLLIVKNHHTDNVPLAKNSKNNLENKLIVTFLISYLIPIFGLYGIFILPDSGLILGLSIMLYASDQIYRIKRVNSINSLILGAGLGIGLLAKYHILPLGGGMILGLYADLILSGKKNRLINFTLLILSVIIGLIIAAPLFIWNYENHYASFIFQLQHGFSSNTWQLGSLIAFLLGALLYLTPWFAYALIRYGLLGKLRYYLLIPVISLATILIVSSLRKNILPHWIAPAIWLLIPYTVINIKNLKILKIMCRYTSILWFILLFILLLPGGILNIKQAAKLFNPDTTGLADLLLWQELPQLFANNNVLQTSIFDLNNAKHPIGCHNNSPLIGTIRWYWAAQLEYQQALGMQYKILNLDLQSSNFYTWRDNLANYANCIVLIIADSKSVNQTDLNSIISIKNSYTINGIGDYKSLNLIVIEGIFKNTEILSKIQQSLLQNPHY
jgi:hypothetical protein